MRILLTEGSGLTSRQVATRLGELGHEVELLSSSALCLARFTRHVRRVHAVPPFGAAPLAWLEAACTVARERHVDILFPTQEQVTVLAALPERLAVRTLVPPFAALRRVQDKVAADRTLRVSGVPQPTARLLTCTADLAQVSTFPVFVKRAVSTASSGVRRASDALQLKAAFEQLFTGDALLVQEQAAGPLLMIQAIADRGKLLALHANLRVREGAGGGASAKKSVVEPRLYEPITRLVRELSWHGPLSFDAILTSRGPLFIDVNPRLVEPRNALLAGIDLVQIALAIACGEHPAPAPASVPGVCTHQLLLAELQAASSGRVALVREVLQALIHAGPYAGSVEELTPVRRDWLAAFPTIMVGLTALVAPRAAHHFTTGSVGAYALTPRGWAEIIRLAADEPAALRTCPC